MIILSIETSCDETGVSIIEASGGFRKPSFKLLGNTLISQIDIHKEYGGVYPTLAKREHAKNLLPIFESSMRKAGAWQKGNTPLDSKKIKEISKILEREPELSENLAESLSKIKKPKINAIAVTYGPGLEPALWVGINFAKALSLAWEIPLIPVNHMEGHIFSVLGSVSKKKTEKIEFPALSLLISGGHTELVLMRGWLSYKRVGETRDDAVGEAFDKTARMMDLPYPGGPKISMLAEESRQIEYKQPYPLPRPMINSNDLDFSFSGLKTAVLYTLKKIKKKTPSVKRNIAREVEDAITEILISKTRRALKKHKVKTFTVGGGVIANKHIREELTKMIQDEFRATKIILPEREMTTDNAVMIGIAGYLRYLKEKPAFNKTKNNRLKASGSIRL